MTIVMKRIILPAAVCVMLIAASCSNSKTQSSDSQVETIDVSQFTGSNAVDQAHTIDSLALQADFLSADQSVTVLVGLSEIVKYKQGNERLEYMRKYLDAYEILTSRGDEFVQAITSSKSATGIDLPGLFSSYHDVLNNEADDGTAFEDGDQGATSVEKKADSVEKKAEAPAAPADSIH